MTTTKVPLHQLPIYKVCSRSDWETIRTLDAWAGSPHDLRDGFIHFSAAHQLAGTVSKHFAGQSNLMLISVDPVHLGDRLKWETSRDGDLFPHLYGPLLLAAVIDAQELVMNEGRIQGVDKSESQSY